MSKMLWGGRFAEGPSKIMLDYCCAEDLKLDELLVPYDIQGSKAHAVMLAKNAIVPEKDVAKILKGLDSILDDWRNGKYHLKLELEDVHMNVENELGKRVGESAGKLHTARSRNDQIALDMRLFYREELDELSLGTVALIETLVKIGSENKETIMPFYTHMQHAQPTTLGHWCSCQAFGFLRDLERIQEARKKMNENPLGAGAGNGTSFPIDRKMTAKLLGFETVAENSADAVSARAELDADVAFVCGQLMTHMSRVAQDLALWSTVEHGMVELSDAWTTGSSMMPNKKNPDPLELLRANAAIVAHVPGQSLSVGKALQTGYNRDFQAARQPVFNALTITGKSLVVLAGILQSMKLKKKRMTELAEEGHTTATELANFYVRKGMPFRKAHEKAGLLVRKAIAEDKKLWELLEGGEKKAASVANAVNANDSQGGCAPAQVAKQLKAINEKLQEAKAQAMANNKQKQEAEKLLESEAKRLVAKK